MGALAMRFKRLENRFGKEKKVIAGVVFDAPYALKVHEDLEAFHSNGQAKYLEQPAREYREDMGRAVTNYVKNGYSLRQAIFYSLNILLRAAKELVPVKTGFLKSTGRVVVRNE